MVLNARPRKGVFNVECTLPVLPVGSHLLVVDTSATDERNQVWETGPLLTALVKVQ